MNQLKVTIFPLKLLIFNLVFTFITAFVMIFISIKEHQSKNNFIERDIIINEFIWEIMYFDEALTMTAYLYAETGNDSWKKRYLTFEQKLDETLLEIKESLKADAERLSYIYQTTTANEILVGLEKKSFELVDNKQIDKARNTLNSNEYLKNKQQYFNSIQKLKTEEKIKLEEKAKLLNIFSIFSVILILLLLVSVAILWIILAKKIKNWFLQIEEAHKSLSESKQEMALSNKKLSKFVYVCSHDMKEPVRNIFNIVELLENDRSSQENNKKQNEYFSYLKDSSKKIYNLIDSLLKHSKEESENSPSMKSNFSLQTLIENVIKYERSFNKNLTVNIPNNLPEINGYKFQIEQLFQNLIGNSIKYKQDNKAAEITIKYTKLKKYHKFTLKDNGIGIDPTKLKKVFDLNYTTEAKSRSSGIGLSICKDIVCGHKGKIIANSKGKNQGSSFIITLPV